MNTNRVYNGFIKVDKVETKQGVREVVTTTNSVAMLVFDSTNDLVYLARQPRAPMISKDNPNGFITEVSAGRIDHNASVKAIVVEEVKEELGIEVAEDEVVILNQDTPLATSPGVLTEKMYLVYVEIQASKIDFSSDQFGNAQEGEEITRITIPVSKLESLVLEDLKLFALVQWFLLTKVKK